MVFALECVKDLECISCYSEEDQKIINNFDTRNIGYILHKNPDSFLEKDLKFGKSYIFYPEATKDKTTICMILDINPLELAKGEYGYAGTNLFDYVNDGAYASNSFLAMALKKNFSTAMSGNSKDEDKFNQDLLEDEIVLIKVHLYGVRCSLGYAKRFWGDISYIEDIHYSSISEYVDETYQEFGTNPYIDIHIKSKGKYLVEDILQQVYVFLNTCSVRHNYMNKEDEFDKFYRYINKWFPDYLFTDKKEIVRRYFSKVQGMDKEFLDKYYPPSNARYMFDNYDKDEKEESLNSKRNWKVFETVYDILKNNGADTIKNLVDLGCGSGKQLYNLISNPGLNINQYYGVDITDYGRRILKNYDNFTFFNQSILYKNDELKDKDIMTCIEMIEHLNPEMIPVFNDLVFGYYKPKAVIITTPNRSLNAGMKKTYNGLRHPDHRFEFNEEEAIKYAIDIVSKYDYKVETNEGTVKYYDTLYSKYSDTIYATFVFVFKREDII